MRQTMKKFLALILCFAMLLTTFPVDALATGDGTPEGNPQEEVQEEVLLEEEEEIVPKEEEKIIPEEVNEVIPEVKNEIVPEEEEVVEEEIVEEVVEEVEEIDEEEKKELTLEEIFDGLESGAISLADLTPEQLAAVQALMTDAQTASEVSVTGVSLDKSSLTLTVGETATLTATVSPEDATNKNVSWSSSDESVATVSGGNVTAVKEGSATITATTADGSYQATCTVTVKPAPVAATGVDMTEDSIKIAIGGTGALTATLQPEGAVGTITWTSSDESIATVIDGVVSGLTEGTATITATVGEFSDTATVTVKPSFTVTFYQYDADGALEQYGSTQSVLKGDFAVKPDDPLRDGYAFSRWTVDGNPVEDVENYAITKATEFIPTYDLLEKYTVTVSYIAVDPANHNSEKSNVAVPMVYEVGTEDGATQAIALNTITGYDVVGVDVSDPDHMVTDDLTSVSFTYASGDMTANQTIKVLYAPKSVTYKVSYQLEALDGSYEAAPSTTGEPNPVEITGKYYGDKVTERATRTYKGFTLATGAQTLTLSSDTVFTFQYTRNSYFLRFQSNGGDAVVSKTYKHGKTVELPAAKDMLREGYTFAGWYTDEACTESVPADYTMPIPESGDAVTLYAKWTPKTVTYYVYLMTQNLKADESGVAGTADTDYTYYDVRGPFEALSGTQLTEELLLDNFADSYPDVSYFGVNDSKTVEKLPEIAGDSSTIVRIYYDRTSYTLTFNPDGKLSVQEGWFSKEYNVDGKIYFPGQTAKEEYTLEAVLGQDISAKWPQAAYVMGTYRADNKTKDATFYGWNLPWDNTNAVTKRLNMTTDLCRDKVDQRTLTGLWSKLYTYKARYKLWDAEKAEYILDERYNDTIQSGGDLRAKNIDGYVNNGSKTVTSSEYDTTLKETVYTKIFCYDLAPLKLTLKNGGDVYKTYSEDNRNPVYYKEDITEKLAPLTDAKRPSGLSDDYHFAGWYENAAAEGAAFAKKDDTGVKMPNHDLILYAGWKRDGVTVTFVDDQFNHTAGNPVELAYGASLAASDIPAWTQAGYTLAGWSKEKDSDVPFDTSSKLAESMTLHAIWTRIANITLKVQPKADVAEVMPNSIKNSSEYVYTLSPITYEERVMVTAGEPFKGTDNAWYVPTFRTTTVEVPSTAVTAGTETNTYIYEVVYERNPEITYTVHYEYADGGKVTFADPATNPSPKTVKINSEVGEYKTVVENYVNIPGYYPNYYQQSLSLVAGTDNVMTFVYKPNAKAGYHVRVYKQNLTGGSYTLADTYDFTDDSDKGAVGTTKSVNADTYKPDGFTYNTGLSNASVMLRTGNDNFINLYYDRTTVTVTFKVEDGQTGWGSIKGEATFSGRYGTAWENLVTDFPAANDKYTVNAGYKFQAWTPGFPAASAAVTADGTYVVSFERDGDQWHTVTYDANWTGTGLSGTAPVDNTTYVAGATVTVQGKGDLAVTDHSFQGWNTKTDGTGASYVDTFMMPDTDVILYAQWQAYGEAKLAYHANKPDGFAVTPMDETSTRTQKVETSHPFTVEDRLWAVTGGAYTFKEWNTKADGTGDTKAVGATITVNAGETANLYAIWEKTPNMWFGVTYHANFGTLTGTSGTAPVDNNTYLKDATVKVLGKGDLDVTGHSFMGWYTDAACTTPATPYTKDSTLTMGSANVDLYAKWQANEVTITYMTRIGTADYSFDREETLNYGETPKDYTPTMKGHTFGGWFEDETNTKAWTKPATLTGNVTVYGTFTVDSYKLNFYLVYPEGSGFGDQSVGKENQSVPYGEQFAAPATFTIGQPGYELDGGWYIKTESGTGIMPTTMPAGDLNVYRNLKQSVYTVTYAPGAHGTWEATDAKATNAGLHYNEDTPAFRGDTATDHDAGWTFDGWNTVGGTVADKVTGTVTYTAQWKQIDYTVIYAPGTQGTWDAGDETTTGKHYGDPRPAFNGKTTETTDPGWEFDGWKDGDGNDWTPGANDTVTGNATYTAQWRQIDYTVIYAPGTQGTWNVGDETYGTLHYGDPRPAFNGNTTKTTDPGWEFDGWEDGNGNVWTPGATDTVTGNATYTAQWKQIDYTVTYAPGDHGAFTAQVYGDGTPETEALLHYGDTTPAFVGDTTGEDGWEFTGWTPTVAGTVTGNATYTAQWKRGTFVYTVQYVYNGMLDADKTTTDSAEFGKALAELKPSDAVIRRNKKDGFYFTSVTYPKGSTTVTSNPDNNVIQVNYAANGTITFAAKDAIFRYDGAQHGVELPTVNLMLKGSPSTISWADLEAAVGNAITLTYYKGSTPDTQEPTNASQYWVDYDGLPTSGVVTIGGVEYTVNPGTSPKLTILPVRLTLKALPQSRVYNGTPLTYAGYEVSVYQAAGDPVPAGKIADGESISGVKRDASVLNVSDGHVENPITGYTVTLKSGSVDTNYDVTFDNTDDDLWILPATLTVTADSKTKATGEVNPPLTYTVAGYVNGETAAKAITGVPTLVTTATTASPSGTYPITVALGTLASVNGNYAFRFVNGTLTVDLDYYTVRYRVAVVNAAGVQTEEYTYASYILPVGDPIAAVGTPARAGYTFSGWTGVRATMPDFDFTVRGTLTENAVVPTPTPIPTVPPTDGPVTTPEPTRLETITDDATPLAGPAGRAWALLNLILAIATALASVLMLIGYIGKKKEQDETGLVIREVKKHGFLRILTLLPGIGGIVAFILTENMKNPMAFTDQWTLLMVVIALIQLLIVLLGVKSERDAADRDNPDAA